MIELLSRLSRLRAAHRPLQALISGLCLCAAASGALGAPPHRSTTPLRHGRITVVIDESWKFRTDTAGTGEAQGWARQQPADAKDIRVPSLWSASAAPGYSGTAWYWRETKIPADWKGQTIRLQFEAAAGRSEVWLNGEKLGDHGDEATPFEFNITKGARIGEKNLIAVKVDGDHRTGAGLWQGVLLLSHDEAYINDVFVRVSPTGSVAAEISLINNSEHTGDANLNARIVTADEPAKDVKRSLQNLKITPNRNITILNTGIPTKRVALWSPSSPSLYYLQLAFRQEKDVLDTTETSFGIRQLGWRNGEILLNGAPLSFKATAVDLATPIVVATTEDETTARSLLQNLKTRGVNLVYLDAAPPALLSLADQTGMMVVEGARTRLQGKSASSELLGLIQRDRNHPCIVGWNLRAAPADIAAEARKLDAGRFLLFGAGREAQLQPPGSAGENSTPPPAGFMPQ